MIIVGSFLPSRLVGQHHQLYLGLGADIVMESISAQGRVRCARIQTASLKLRPPDKISGSCRKDLFLHQIIFMDSVREAAVEGERRLELPSPSLEVALRQAIS